MKDLKDLKGPQTPAFFANRVLANLDYEKQQNRVSFWKLVSGFSLVLGAVLSFYFFNLSQKAKLPFVDAPVNKLVVLQLDEIPHDSRIAYVSLEIDSDMRFQISDPELATKKEITLAIDSGEKAKRLPFVFLSQVKGLKLVKVKFLDFNFNLVKEDQHYLNFSDKSLKEGEI